MWPAGGWNMEIVKLALEYIKALVWPLTVLAYNWKTERVLAPAVSDNYPS